jgi:two-component system, OmpR family, sensor kinase
MWATGSWARRHALDLAWAAFAAANIAVILTSSQWETIPFHNVWVSLTLVYGLRVWSMRTTVAVTAAVTLGTGLALARVAFAPGGPGPDEVAEVPMMLAMFLAMVWHARRREAALATVRAVAEKDRQFARDASHVLRTPIAIARGHVELIRDSARDPQLAEDAGVVLEELERLSRIAHRLLLLASADHPDFLARTPVDAEEMLVDVARRWGPAAGRSWRVGPIAEGTLEADREQLTHAIDSLVENAVKYSRPGDEIGMTSWADGTALVIEVTDTGPGIPPDRLATVFDRFRRSAGSGGAGLGLPLARAIVEAHGGSVCVASAEGVGTTFRLRLPCLRAEDWRPVKPSRPAGHVLGAAIAGER